MEQYKNAFYTFLEDLLPAPLKPYTSKVFAVLAIVAVLLLLTWAFGFRFILTWVLGTLFLIVFMAAWVVISEFFKKLQK